MRHETEKSCYNCEEHFMVLADTEAEVCHCPFCGEALEEERDEDDEESDD